MYERSATWGVEELTALAAASRRLRHAGCSVGLRHGSVLWRSRSAALSSMLTPELIEDAKLIVAAARKPDKI